jgi:energy-coupling factor transporter ATP-binding protein EcfA2
MMLQQLTLENFKGLKSAKVDFGRFTVLIGPNGTGKSSISQALMLLRQSLGNIKLQTDGPLINLGIFDDVLTKGVSKREIGIGLSVGVGANVAFGTTSGASYSYSAYFGPGLIRFDAAIVSENKELLLARWGGKRANSIQPKQVIDNLEGGKLLLRLGLNNMIARPIIVTSHSFPEEFADIGQAFENHTQEFLSTITILLGKTYYVPAIRGLDKPEYELRAESKTDFAAGANAEVASAFAYAGRDVAELVSIWTQSITGSDIDASVVPGRKVTIRSYAAAGGIPVIGDGFGTNQLVQLLLTLAIIPSGSVLAIEEPEIHLHPKAQKNLCDILVEIGKAHDKQIILSTHSEHVLFRFVEAVRNKKLTRDELAIYYFEEKGKEPYLVEQDKYGDIYDWGTNFLR